MEEKTSNGALASLAGPGGKRAAGMPGMFLTGEQERKLKDFRKTKFVASALFFLMLICYSIFKYYENAYAWLGFFRAFTEAAMVGALADWFAVTALFRHPLGIRLPHTAIIPTNKERIGENIGQFVEGNFFAAATIDEKLKTRDLTGDIAEWFNENTFMVDELCLVLPHVLHAVDDREIRRFVRENIISGMRSVELAPLLAQVLASMTAENKLGDYFDHALKITGRLLEKAKPFIRQKISEKSPWYVKIFGMDDTIYDRLIASIEDEMENLRHPRHNLRIALQRKIEELVEKLKTSPEMREKVGNVRDSLLNNRDFINYLDNAWNSLEPMILDDLARDDSHIRGRLTEALRVLCRGLLQEESVRERINILIRDVLTGIIRRHPHAISTFINREVRKWDTATLVQQTEIAIGSDLQFIRINGTLIGGLVGLLMYSISRFVISCC